MSASTPVSMSKFAQGLTTETAFDVLAVAKRLKAKGKDVIELQIGDSPFPTTKHAKQAGMGGIECNATHYCASLGWPAFRETVAKNYTRESVMADLNRYAYYGIMGVLSGGTDDIDVATQIRDEQRQGKGAGREVAQQGRERLVGGLDRVDRQVAGEEGGRRHDQDG